MCVCVPVCGCGCVSVGVGVGVCGWGDMLHITYIIMYSWPLVCAFGREKCPGDHIAVCSPPMQVDAKYSVQFEDNTYPEGYSPPLSVPQRFVIPSKETRKGRS